MDHWMPEMDGVEAVKRIRALNETLPERERADYFKRIPIIALTANAISGTQDMLLKNGFNGFLAKPIDTVKLESILIKWIPTEKQKRLPSSAGEAAEKKEQDASHSAAQNVLEEIFEIEGIDIKKGIAQSGGSIKRYRMILDDFYEDGLEKIKELKACLETDNIPLYTIHVHALKSAAANIGADGLSQAARDLEAAGEKTDLGFIKAHTPVLLESLELLLKNILDALSAHNNKTGDEKNDSGSIDANTLKNKLAELKAAVEILDAGTMNNTVDDLLELKLSENISAAVKSISKCILMGEYNKALTLIESILPAIV
jgi:CheY-like chemotaxis protein